MGHIRLLVMTAGAGLAPHRSASLFGVTLPQPECPWFIEAVWALTDYHVTLAPRSHLIRTVPRDIEKTAAEMATTSVSVTVPAGSLLVQHPVSPQAIILGPSKRRNVLDIVRQIAA